MGQFEWIISHTGLLGCPASFQRLLELAMEGLINVIVNIENLLLHLSSLAEHQEQLEKLFCGVRNTGLRANLAECEFGSTN
jgi:hypothetical protein